MRVWMKELRITHYLKNCLIFLPAFFSGIIGSKIVIENLIIGFVCFCMGASAVYLMNDIKDIEKDRMHPQKSKRPIASGMIKISQAWTVAVLLLVLCGCSLILLDAGIRKKAMVVFGIYFFTNVCYSLFGMKKIPLLDVALLVLGFYLRVLMGAVITATEISEWLYLVIITGAFYLAFGKRRNELKVVGNNGRDVLSGYTEQFLDKAMYSCMTMANIFFALWCTQRAESQKYILLVPILMLICFKYSMDIEQDTSDGDPMNVILHDKVLIGLGIILAALTFGFLYW